MASVTQQQNSKDLQNNHRWQDRDWEKVKYIIAALQEGFSHTVMHLLENTESFARYPIIYFL